MIDTLISQKVDILFTLGGDGTQKGANVLYEAIKARGLKISVIGVPKTIDNDIMFVSRTFGFDTAVEEARKAIQCANAEASSARHGIGIVKLMGRESGFVAAKATLANADANIWCVLCLSFIFSFRCVMFIVYSLIYLFHFSLFLSLFSILSFFTL